VGVNGAINYNPPPHGEYPITLKMTVRMQNREGSKLSTSIWGARQSVKLRNRPYKIIW